MSSININVVAEKLLEAVVEYYQSGEYVKPFQSKELADCVVKHAAAGAVAAMGAGLLPGAGGVISAGVGVAAIWTMYIKICKTIGVPFSKNKLKALASALLTNVATQFAGIFALSFLAGAGAVAIGAVNFAVTYFAGLTFLLMLTKLFKTQRRDSLEFSDDAWKDAFKSALNDVDKKEVIKEAKNLFTHMRKDGSLDEMGKDVEFEKED